MASTTTRIEVMVAVQCFDSTSCSQWKQVEHGCIFTGSKSSNSGCGQPNFLKLMALSELFRLLWSPKLGVGAEEIPSRNPLRAPREPVSFGRKTGGLSAESELEVVTLKFRSVRKKLQTKQGKP